MSAIRPRAFSAESLATHIREVLCATRPAGTILVVDDDRGLRNVLRKVLAGESCDRWVRSRQP